jgi:protein TonB
MKKYPKSNLENYRKLFFQLGLVLSLFIVHQLLNHKSYASVEELKGELVQFATQEEELIFQKEPPKVEEKKAEPKTTEIIEKVPDEADVEEDILKVLEPDEDIEPFDINSLETIENLDEEVVEDVSFIIIEDVPVYPGCKSKNKNKDKAKAQLKDCFNSKIQKHVGRKFNPEIASQVGLSPGKKKIYVEFIIDKQGNITQIRARAPHKRLEKEAIRVIELLPQMTPGKQRNVPVRVKYSLPIVFNVQ